MSEFALSLYKGGSAAQQLVNSLNEMFSGKIQNKMTKTHGYLPPIKNVPTVFMAHTAPDLITSDPNDVFDMLLRIGQCRRLILTCQSETKLTETLLSDEEEDAIYDNLVNLGEQLFDLFNAIKIGAVYEMQANARKLLNEYCIKNKKLHNMERNAMLKIELRSRHLKVIKLSGIFACLNHSNDYVINELDVEQAIKSIEYLSQDFHLFYHSEPNKFDKYQKAFEILLKFENRWLSKCELINYLVPLGFGRENLRKNMRKYLDLVNEIALEKGYQISFNKVFFRNGVAYILTKQEYAFMDNCWIGKLNSDILSNDC